MGTAEKDTFTPPEPKSDVMLYSLMGLILTCFAAVIFILDHLLPAIHLLVGLFYLLFVVVTLLICPKKWFILYVAFLCSFLLLAGQDWQAVSTAWQDLVNRLMSLLVIWASVWLGLIQLNVQKDNLSLEERFKRVFSGAPTALILVDRSGRIVLANQQASSQFAAPISLIIGILVEDLIPKEYRKSHVLFRDQYLQHPQARQMGKGRELLARRFNGTTFPVEIGLNPIVLQDGIYVLASIIDITDRKKIEQIKDQFAGVISHEIRTPLATIAAIVDNLASGVEGEQNVEQKEMLELAQKNLSQLNNIIDSLSHYIRFEMGISEIQLSRVSLLTQLGEVASNFKMLAEKAGKEMEIKLPDSLPSILGNETICSQIFNNIFSNALKYAHSKVLISADTAIRPQSDQTVPSHVNQFVHVAITNNGTDIPREIQQKIFEKFYQVGPHHVSASLGLGLYLCKKLMDSQNGFIEIDSGNGWTTFHLFFSV